MAFATQRYVAVYAFDTGARFLLTLQTSIGASLTCVNGRSELSGSAFCWDVAIIALVCCSFGTVALHAIEFVGLVATIKALAGVWSADFA